MLNPLKSAAWRRTVLQWIGGRELCRGARGRSQKPTRLGVESLEERALLSATSPYSAAPLDFPGFADGAPGAYAPQREFDGPVAATWSHDADGYVHDELPPTLEAVSEDRHAVWSPPGNAPLRAFSSEPQVLYIVRLVRVPTPGPLRIMAPTTGLGSSLGGGLSGLPSAAGNSSKAPIAAKAPASGSSSSAGDLQLNVVGATMADRSTSWLPAITSQSQTTARGESPLLRALESRDAVFRALAAPAGKRAGDMSQSFSREGEENADSLEVDAHDSEADDSDAHDEGRAWVDSLAASSLRDVTDQQAASIAAILHQLAAEHAEHRSQPERNSDAGLPIPTEPAASPADATTSTVDQGGMILLRGRACDAVLADVADGASLVDDPPHSSVGMQAEIGLYQAFGMAAGAPVDDVPAAAAWPVQAGSPQGGAEHQNARESTPAPPASASPEAVVTASVVSLTVAASGLRTRSYPQMRHQRR